jgi:hypothetical protein
MPHERTGRFPISTVQAPHCWIPQPNLVPVKPTVSRSAHSKGVSGSRLRVCCFPLIFKVVILPPSKRLNDHKTFRLKCSILLRLSLKALTVLTTAETISDVFSSPSAPCFSLLKKLMYLAFSCGS